MAMRCFYRMLYEIGPASNDNLRLFHEKGRLDSLISSAEGGGTRLNIRVKGKSYAYCK